MSLKLVTKIANVSDLSNYLQSKLSGFRKSHSTYAKNRLESWIFYEPVSLNVAKVKEANLDWRLLRLANNLNKSLNIGLITYNGNGSDGRIKPHRDATYAKKLAYLINVGEANFYYDSKTYQLENGGIYSFNCKTLHGIESASDNRFGIIFWELKPNTKIIGDSLKQRIEYEYSIGF